jgi:WD40 repeat protein
MLTADAAPIQSIASFRNGDMAGNFASGDSSGSICRWNPVTGEPIGAPIETGEPISSMATESLGNTPLLLASGASREVRVWHAITGDSIDLAIRGNSISVLPESDGEILLAAGSAGGCSTIHSLSRVD